MSEYVKKSLSYTDIVGKMSVPIEWLGGFLPDIELGSQVQLNVVDHKTNKSYSFTLKTRPQGPNKKPVFQSGWHEFVRDNPQLQIDDTLYFWKETSTAADDVIINLQLGDPPRLHKLFGVIFSY